MISMSHTRMKNWSRKIITPEATAAATAASAIANGVYVAHFHLIIAIEQ